MHFLSPRAACLPIAAALFAATAHAAAPELPPPGLYRIDSEGQARHGMGPHEARISVRTGGASGDETTRSVVAGQDSGSRTTRGSGPLTHCVKAGPPVVPPAFAKGLCKTQSTSRSADGMVQVASCPTGALTLRIRRLDDRTWEYVTETDMSSGTTPNLGGTRTMLEMAARGAGTAEERARAAKALAELPRMEAALNRDRAGAETALQQALADAKTPQEAALVRQAMARIHGRVPIKTRERTTLTRIADHCTAG